jgi:hypothetical protein
VLTVLGVAVGASLSGVTVIDTVPNGEVSEPCVAAKVKLSGPV